MSGDFSPGVFRKRKSKKYRFNIQILKIKKSHIKDITRTITLYHDISSK